MQVNLYATFRNLAGCKHFELELPAGSTLRGAVNAITAAYPQLHSHWLDEQGEIHAHVHGFINGEDAATLPDGWDTRLNPEDVLDFLPPVAGGTQS